MIKYGDGSTDFEHPLRCVSHTRNRSLILPTTYTHARTHKRPADMPITNLIFNTNMLCPFPDQLRDASFSRANVANLKYVVARSRDDPRSAADHNGPERRQGQIGRAADGHSSSERRVLDVHRPKAVRRESGPGRRAGQTGSAKSEEVKNMRIVKDELTMHFSASINLCYKSFCGVYVPSMVIINRQTAAS